MQDRKELLLDGLAIENPGLEVSPLYRPTATRPQANVFYTDYCSSEESRRKHNDYEHPPIMEIDFVWNPQKDLMDCVPDGMKFNWAVSSHVLEHVPNPIGWLNQVLEVINVGGVFSLALPDKRYCYDKFRESLQK